MLRITKKSDHALVLKGNRKRWEEALIAKIEEKIKKANAVNFPRCGIVVDISGLSPREDITKAVSELYKKAGWKVEFRKYSLNTQQMILK